MTDDNIRPSPEQLLQRIEVEEKHQSRGKLKIFLGSSPGVGKTCTMLEEAAEKLGEGVDVVGGVVVAHGRKETELLLEPFELLPAAKYEYQGKTIEEFDLDAALARQPELILVDEMAHTNAQGARHTKRWQDIKELVDRGINVYTTLNVQHIESLNDVIAQITGIIVREMVPDSMLELAQSIELVDLPPDDLLKRLREGKIYIPQQAELAAEHFFRKGNLIALRELALRVTAERVDADVLLHRRDQSIKKRWATNERLIVCISADPSSAKLIRAAKRLATQLKSEWFAVFVDAPKLNLSEEARANVMKNMRLAETLGAEAQVLVGNDLVKEILSFAREQNASKIVIGRHVRARWKDLLFGSLVDELVRNSAEIDIYVIRGEGETEKSRPQSVLPTKSSPIRWWSYINAFLVFLGATGLNFLLSIQFPIEAHHPNNLMMVYLLAIILVAVRGQRWPSISMAVLCILAFDFFFVPPRFSFSVAHDQYLVSLVFMAVLAYVIIYLSVLTHKQTHSARMREKRTTALYILNKQLATTRGVEQLLQIAGRYISEVFDSQTAILLPNDHNEVEIRCSYPDKISLDDKEQSIAQWVYDLGKKAGLGTQTLSVSQAVYLPLSGTKSTLGVLRVQPKVAEHLLHPEQMQLLEAFTNQIAYALEVDRLGEETKKTQMQVETEQLRNNLLNSVSRDLRIPLTSIMSATSGFLANESKLNRDEVRSIVANIHQESEKLNQYIENILQLTKVD
jgi:two-component system sensor histidine kinase KdpD